MVYMLTLGVYIYILMVNVTIYIAYMDPMGQYSARKRQFQVSKVCGLDAEFSLRLQVHQDVHKS